MQKDLPSEIFNRFVELYWQGGSEREGFPGKDKSDAALEGFVAGVEAAYRLPQVLKISQEEAISGMREYLDRVHPDYSPSEEDIEKESQEVPGKITAIDGFMAGIEAAYLLSRESAPDKAFDEMRFYLEEMHPNYSPRQE